MSSRRSGTYVLLMELLRPARLTIGRLGIRSFASGWYAYVGSAMNGVDQRVARHLRRSPVLHWHIDYLRPVAPVREVWIAYSEQRLECRLTEEVVALDGAGIPVRGFGSSDCPCEAHLIHFDGRPDLSNSLPGQLTKRPAGGVGRGNGLGCAGGARRTLVGGEAA